MDNETAITILKTHFNPKKLNAIYVEDNNFYITLEKVYSDHFASNKQLKIIKCEHFLEDIIDENQLAKIIEEQHLKNNHRGITESIQQLKLKFYHPKLSEHTTIFINNCEICNIEKYDRKPIKQKFQITETPICPNQIIHMDVLYTFKKELFVTFIDKFSKFAQAIKINARTWIEFKRVVLQFISSYGHVNKIVTDNELGLKAIPFTEFLRNQNIEMHFTSNNNHTSNSDIERLHNTFNEHLRLLRHDSNGDTDTIEEKMLKIILFYNNTIHSTTGRKPIDFKNGNIKNDEYNDILERIKKIKEKTINKLNENREDVEVPDVPGPSFIKDERGGKHHAKFKILDIEKMDENHFKNKTNNFKYYKSHIKRRKKFQNINNPTVKAKPKADRK